MCPVARPSGARRTFPRRVGTLPPTLRAVLAVVLTTLAIAAVAVVAPSSERDAAAQAKLVNAWVRTFPPKPEPGTDVTAVVGVEGCPTGPVTVEIYLTASDGSGEASTLVARAAATTSLVHRTRAVLSLPQAIEGWYGARVLCGTFRPPRSPMANTYFAVGTKPGKEARLADQQADIGTTVNYAGNGCSGAIVEYDIRQGDAVSAAFQVDGTIPVRADGTWSADIPIGTDLRPGTASIRARCILTDASGQRIEVYYGRASSLTLLAPVTSTTGA